MDGYFALFTVIVLGFATHRVTRLLTRDRLPLIAAPRAAFVQRWATWDERADGKPVDMRVGLSGKPTNILMRSLAYLWECDWCMSVWTGGILILITVQYVDLPLPWLAWPAVSSIAGLIAQREPDEH